MAVGDLDKLCAELDHNIAINRLLRAKLQESRAILELKCIELAITVEESGKRSESTHGSLSQRGRADD
jgi:hypothetical protein